MNTPFLPCTLGFCTHKIQLQPPDDIDLPIQLSDFRDAARKLRGSRDVGTQVFCALLRSARTEARLVCSLHPLPFQPAQKIELSQIKQNALKLRTQVREKIPGQDSENDTGTDGSLLGRSVTPEPASSSIPVRSKGASFLEFRRCIYLSY